MDYNKLAAYILAVALLGLSIYLKSPLVAIASVILFGFHYGHEILLKVQDNKEIVALRAEISNIRQTSSIDRQRIEEMEKDLSQALVRVRETLGESF